MVGRVGWARGCQPRRGSPRRSPTRSPPAARRRAREHDHRPRAAARPTTSRSRASSRRSCATEGAVPATIAVVDGEVRIGLDDARARGDGARRRRRRSAACATSPPVIAARRLGGDDRRLDRPPRRAGRHRRLRHRRPRRRAPRGARELGRVGRPDHARAHRRHVVCAGVKSILDVGATLERLETLNVCVLGYGTDRFPGFYLADSGFPRRRGGSTRPTRSPA